MNANVQAAAVGARHAGGLEHFPVALFSMVMGMTGLAIAWHRAHVAFGAPELVGQGVRVLSSLLFALLLVLYLAKWVKFPKAAAAEANHPIRVNFLPAISIDVLLLATAWLQDAPFTASALWIAGVVLHLVLTLRTFGSWLHHTYYDIKHVNPAWFIPVVGNIVVPLAGVKIASPEVSWFFFSIGIVFWFVLLTIVMNRLFFHEPLPVKLLPTMFILLAPPSVGFLSWIGLTGHLDAFGRVLYYAALFMALLLFSNAPRFLRLPFFVSSWAYSFPLAAFTIATITMYDHIGGRLLAACSMGLLALLSIVVVLLVVRTGVAAVRGQVCVSE